MKLPVMNSPLQPCCPAAFCLACPPSSPLSCLLLLVPPGLSLDEVDRMNKYALAGDIQHYHGEACNPKHLSPWEIWMVSKWCRNSTWDEGPCGAADACGWV